MEATTWLDRQQEQCREAPATGAGAALPLVLWAVVLLGTGGGAVIREVPLWAYAMFAASPALLLGFGLAARALIASIRRGSARRRACRAAGLP
jgi:hypothetical protein